MRRERQFKKLEKIKRSREPSLIEEFKSKVKSVEASVI